MKLESISVSRYRSISSAKKIRLDQSTVLIGPNNEGKSNILRGLVLAMTVLTRGRQRVRIGRRFRTTYNLRGYNWNMDFPISLQKKSPNGETEIILDFRLEDGEHEEFKNEIKSNISGNLPLKIAIGREGVAVTYYKKGRNSAALSKKSDKIADFVASKIEFEHIPAVRTAESAQDIVSELVSRELRILEDDSEYQKAVAKIEELQQPILDKLSDSIHTTLKQFLKHVRSVEISLPQAERLRAIRRGVEIFVNDGVKTPLDYKGDGVQSLAALGIIRHASERSGKGKNFVVAIEEPESHLHPNAIHELKDVIDDLSDKHQVIVTSHNPLFVDRRFIGNNIVVKDRKARPARNVEEIRKILGVRASDNLTNAELVLVVEGEEDIRILKAIIEANSEYLKQSIENGTLAFDFLGGGTNLSYKLSQLRSSICLYHVFLDDDKCGRESYKKAKSVGLLDDGQVNFAKAIGRDESEIEDLLKVDVYKSAIEAKFRVSLDNPKFKGKKKWSDRLHEVFKVHGKQWDDSIEREIKYLVSQAVINSPEEALTDRDSTIVSALIMAIEARLKEKEKAQQDASDNA